MAKKEVPAQLNTCGTHILDNYRHCQEVSEVFQENLKHTLLATVSGVVLYADDQTVRDMGYACLGL